MKKLLEIYNQGIAKLDIFTAGAEFLAVLAGIFWFWLLKSKINKYKWFISAALIIAAVFIADIFEQISGISDPRLLKIDEFAAVPLIFIFYQPKNKSNFIKIAFLAAIAFSIFDWLKPFGIAYLGKIPGGLGILLDDIAAAVLVGILFWLGKFLFKNRMTY